MTVVVRILLDVVDLAAVGPLGVLEGAIFACRAVQELGDGLPRR